MKREYRVTIEAEGTQPAEELLNTLRKMSDKAEREHGISVDVQRLETTDVDDTSGFTTASND